MINIAIILIMIRDIALGKLRESNEKIKKIIHDRIPALRRYIRLNQVEIKKIKALWIMLGAYVKDFKIRSI
jgi:hypothetical protein